MYCVSFKTTLIPIIVNRETKRVGGEGLKDLYCVSACLSQLALPSLPVIFLSPELAFSEIRCNVKLSCQRGSGRGFIVLLQLERADRLSDAYSLSSDLKSKEGIRDGPAPSVLKRLCRPEPPWDFPRWLLCLQLKCPGALFISRTQMENEAMMIWMAQMCSLEGVCVNVEGSKTGFIGLCSCCRQSWEVACGCKGGGRGGCLASPLFF